MRITRITRDVMRDHDGSDIMLYADTGERIGTLTFDGKGNSRFDLAPGQLPYRVMVSKRKHRGRS